MYFKLGALFLLGSLSISSALPPCVCTRNFSPVCGSDGQTYNNKCMLQCAQVSNPKLVMKRTGRCDGASFGLQRKVREVQGDCVICPLDYTPLCGTDGVTYPNRCSFRCNKRSPNVQIAYPGECRNKRDAVKVAEIPSRCTCPRNFIPVCGTDNETYNNNCLLECMIKDKPELRLRHVGSCENVVQSCTCSKEAMPVCGTDGITYENPCVLECAKKNNQDLDMLHVGECDNSVKVVNSACTCTREGRPVCGTDGNTYNNPCLLNCARANDESLIVDYEGQCDNRVKVVEEAENLSCTCTRNFKPVCASNGVTFNNECLLKCAGTHLSVAKEGPCEE